MFIFFNILIVRGFAKCDAACGCNFEKNPFVFNDTTCQSVHLLKGTHPVTGFL